MSKVYLVLGPEGSGTRMVTGLLIEAGCQGDASHSQRWDNGCRATGNVVWRRSFPHLGDTPDIERMLESMPGRQPFAVITIRDPYCIAGSHVLHGQAGDVGDSVGRQRQAYRDIFKQLFDLSIPFVFAVYEALVARPYKATRELCSLCGLAFPENAKMLPKDANGKYYGEDQ